MVRFGWSSSINMVWTLVCDNWVLVPSMQRMSPRVVDSADYTFSFFNKPTTNSSQVATTSVQEWVRIYNFFRRNCYAFVLPTSKSFGRHAQVVPDDLDLVTTFQRATLRASSYLYSFSYCWKWYYNFATQHQPQKAPRGRNWKLNPRILWA